MPKIKLKKESPKADTLFVSSKSDPRIKAYKDSTSLYNKSLKDKKEYLDYLKALGLGLSRMRSGPASSKNKIKPVENVMLESGGTAYNRNGDLSTNYAYRSTTGNDAWVDKYIHDKIEKGYNKYKKPVQPVVYREEVKEVVKESTPVKSEPIQKPLMQYDGEPVYHHTALGDKGIIGFVKDGKMTKISPEDFDRFAVPKETRQLILNQEAVDKYMESRLGKYYKR